MLYIGEGWDSRGLAQVLARAMVHRDTLTSYIFFATPSSPHCHKLLIAMKSDRTLNLSRKNWYLKLIDRSGQPRLVRDRSTMLPKYATYYTDFAYSFCRHHVSPLWANHEVFSALIHDIEEHFEGVQYDLIIAIDTLGFILGAAIASSSGKGLVPLRKGGKLPLPEERLMSVEFQDYDQTRKKFEVVKDLVKPGNYPATTTRARSDMLSSNSRESSVISR